MTDDRAREHLDNLAEILLDERLDLASDDRRDVAHALRSFAALVEREARFALMAQRQSDAISVLERENLDYASALRTIAATCPRTAGVIAREALEGTDGA